MNHKLSDAQVLGVITPSFYNVERTVYAKRYPSYDYAALVPVLTEGNEWARGTMFYTSDIAGKAEWLAGKGFDMPYADVSRGSSLTPFHMAGIGYEWSLEEVSVAAMEGRSLSSEKAEAAKRVAENKLWNVAMTGDTEKGMTGLLNDANVPTANAAATGSGSTRTFSTKTPDNILADVNAIMAGVINSTLETELADTLLLPSSSVQYLASTRISTNSDTTVLEFVRKNNAYSSQTGRDLTIRGLRTLETAGSGGTRRMLAYTRDPDIVRFHLPMPHKFLPPFQKGSVTWEIAGIMRTGGTEVRRPKAMSYVDGI
jgi:hypothetical protein